MLEVINIVKRYGTTPVLNRATFTIAEGQLTTFLGPSGCGKSTRPRCLNRLETFDEGLIRIGDAAGHGSASQPLSPAAEKRARQPRADGRVSRATLASGDESVT